MAGLEVFEEYEGCGESREFIGYTKKTRLADKLGALQALLRDLASERKALAGTNGRPIKEERSHDASPEAQALINDLLVSRSSQGGLRACPGGVRREPREVGLDNLYRFKWRGNP